MIFTLSWIPNSLTRSSAFCCVRFVSVTFALLLLVRETRIARDAPPAPMTRTFLFSRIMPSSFREFWKPIQSVLLPVFVSLNDIVFTALICFASFDISSRCFMTSTLCGIVTLMPSRFVVFMNCSRSSGAMSNLS